jgi:DNA gyrase inhibitor GyrI
MWGRLDAMRKERFYPRDFMYHDQEKGGSVWCYAIEEWVSEKDTEGFEITHFEGGLYATSIVHDFDVNEVTKAYNGIKEWIAQHSSFAFDERPGHAVMFQVTVPHTYELLGYRQVEYYFPVKIREG